MSGFECDNERNIKTSGVKYYVYTVVDREPSLYIYIYIFIYLWNVAMVRHREMASDQVNVVGFLRVGIVGRNGTRNYAIINILRSTRIVMQQRHNERN